MTDTLSPPRRASRARSDRTRLRSGDATPRVVDAEPGEDPRIRDRRRSVQADRRRRRRAVLFVALAVVVLVASAVALSRSAWFDVDRIVVDGPDGLDRDELRQASGIDRGDAMVDVDLSAARRSIMALPSVASARVEREWPGTIRVVVRAEIPLAVLAGEDRRVLVGRGGRVLAELGAEDRAPDGLPTVSVEDPSALSALEVGATLPEPLSPVVVVLEQLPEPLRSRSSAVTLDAAGNLSMALRADPAVDGSDGTVELGRADELPSKLLAAASIVAGARMECLDVLDVREPSRPTISRDRGCDPGPPTVGATTVPARTEPDGTARTADPRSGRTSTSTTTTTGRTAPATTTTAPGSTRRGAAPGGPG
ncbi:MAG TPA: FtsQ-type POTRA domain-containing protein [Microthrixaceae bacterium]|nr:FtsQ-type POTRA domain-containing protein [Microthrixaceae bacterium]